MKRLAFASVALLLVSLLVSCSDETSTGRTPTAPPAPSLSLSTGAAPKGLSTVCLSYMTQLANTHEKLEKARAAERADVAAEAKLAKKVESFEKLVTDACR